MRDIEILELMTGETNYELLSVLLDEATEYVLAYTNRTIMIPALKKTARDLAVIALNRIGTEGESGRSEAGETYSFDNAPKHIYDILNRYRLVRIGGKTHEAKTQQS
ncbi:Uncharacterised protein [[Eubacterium] contortum]|uniref:Phage gp6-like head-tail connector protein n=1 Tax=Faecalicatena contorta TaxID=39482 RepID=A0A174LSP2_9FIRM|nr:phage head-tail connector protein [Faecalicatena contorta]CUP25038.1 Uncharacterised protein [[Eubacterium] contortum] [Faecalicatena contorta]